MNHPFNLIEFIRIVWRWKIPIGIICALSAVGAMIITDPHIMKPYFTSISVFYPLNPNNTSSSSLFLNEEQSYFGASADVDRILSIAGSVQLKMHIVNKYGLFEHYKIDSATSRYPTYDVLQELHGNYKFERNDKGAVEISVQDHSSTLAAEMANEIVYQIDAINRNTINDNKKKILEIFETKIKSKEIELQHLTDSIFNLKKKNNLYGSIELLKNQVRQMDSERGAQMDAASEQVKLLEEKKKGSIRELNNTVSLFEQYKSTISSNVPTLFVLEKAFPSEKKTKPVRWLVTVGTLLISFLLCSLAAVLIDRFKYIKAMLADDQNNS